MSGKAGPTAPQNGDGQNGDGHGNAVFEGVSTALSWLTVVPLRGAKVFDRTTGARAIAALPIAGLVPGTAAVVWCLLFRWLFAKKEISSPVAATESEAILFALVFGALTVVSTETLTRAMHVDGLADVVDALGSYQPPEAAQKVLRDPTTGPMGVLAVVLHVVVTALAFATFYFSTLNPLAAVFPFVLARLVGSTACVKRFPPMSETGFGGLVAATQRMWVIVIWWIAVAGAAFAVASIPGLIAVVASALVAALLIPHFSKRLGGINGDVLGALIQITTPVATLALIFS